MVAPHVNMRIITTQPPERVKVDLGEAFILTDQEVTRHDALSHVIEAFTRDTAVVHGDTQVVAKVRVERAEGDVAGHSHVKTVIGGENATVGA